MSKTLKVMSIIGIVVSSLSWIALYSCNVNGDPATASEWGFFGILYLLAFSIVGLVQYSRNQK